MIHCRQSFKKVLALYLGIFVLAAPANSLMVKIPLKRLVNESGVIVLGRVQSVWCEWSIDKRLILSIIKVQARDVLKGDLLFPQIIVQVPGGTIGDLSLKVSDMPSFHENEEILVFLQSITNVNDTGNSFTVAQNYLPSFEVYGRAQGKYSADTGGVVRKSGYETLTESEDPEISFLLEKLITQIRTLLLETKQKKQGRR